MPIDHPDAHTIRNMLNELGVLERKYGMGRGAVLMVNPEIARGLGELLLQTAAEAEDAE